MTCGRSSIGRRSIFAVAAVAVAVAALGVAAARAADEAGWRPLFDGKDLDAWTVNGPAEWKVEDGVISGGQFGDAKKFGLLSTKESFTDFELSLDFKIDEHGNSREGLRHGLAVLFFAVALFFVYRSFYGMRIKTDPAHA